MTLRKVLRPSKKWGGPTESVGLVLLLPPHFCPMSHHGTLFRFKVIRDCKHYVNPPSWDETGGSDYTIQIDEYIKLKGLSTNYSGQSAPMTIADINSGALYVYFRALFNSAGVNTILVSGTTTARLRYTD